MLEGPSVEHTSPALSSVDWRKAEEVLPEEPSLEPVEGGDIKVTFLDKVYARRSKLQDVPMAMNSS